MQCAQHHVSLRMRTLRKRLRAPTLFFQILRTSHEYIYTPLRLLVSTGNPSVYATSDRNVYTQPHGGGSVRLFCRIKAHTSESLSTTSTVWLYPIGWVCLLTAVHKCG